MRPIKFARIARKHKIGRAHAVHVINTVSPVRHPATDDLDPRIVWVGPDDRGLELEIIALELPEMLLVIHVMPTALRRKKP
ncbi:hypothetical protein GCM10023321_36640 [Pseudonocardia eucalypti]|uniref:DUF4258 domain-containing protein n=1 Tax=Pseudonocardia eucalypti TaxID=648755 RepID=A0ABP9Q9I5_9PSEU|nr:hypothetical protein [Pseudonocardia eucalypti]